MIAMARSSQAAREARNHVDKIMGAVISRHIFGTSTINLALHRMIMALLGMA